MGMRSLASACGGLGSPGKNGTWAELSPLMRSVILPHSSTRLQRNSLGQHVGGEMGRMDSSLATPLGPGDKGGPSPLHWALIPLGFCRLLEPTAQSQPTGSCVSYLLWVV